MNPLEVLSHKIGIAAGHIKTGMSQTFLQVEY
jgi:hypothetical protein